MKKKKKILVLATYFPPSGGVGVFRVTKFVKYLKRNNYIPVVVTIHNRYCINYDESFLKDISDIKVYRIDFEANGKVAKNFSKCLKQELPSIVLNEKPDIMFLTGGPFQILPLGRKIYDKFKIPYIIDLRDPWSLQKNNGVNVFSKFKCKLVRLRESVFEKYTFKKAKCVCVVNEVMKEEYQKKFPKCRFEVITNGYDLEDFMNITPYKYNEFTIIYSGKFEVSAGFRDPSLFFKALSKIDDVKFVHIGNKEERVIELAKKYNCYDKCEFTGFMSYSEVISHLKGASLLLLISGEEKSEQTGKIFDYMGCQRPILALTNKENDLYKICNSLDNVYIVDDNLEELIKIINNLKQDNEIKKSDVNKKYSREELCKQLIKIIEE